MGSSNNNNSKKDADNRKENIKSILPYDFIEFPKNWIEFKEELPNHNQASELTGYIKYTISPQTDLAIKIYDSFNKNKDSESKKFVKGSSIRGVVRRNLEILSQSFPRFINDEKFLYRDVANKYYKNEITPKGIKHIEEAVFAGFLKKELDKFVLYPAKKELDMKKNFYSIKDFDFINKYTSVLKNENILKDYSCEITIKNKKIDSTYIANELKSIDELSTKIKEKRKELKNLIDNEEIYNDFIININFIFMDICKFNCLFYSKNEDKNKMADKYKAKIEKYKNFFMDNDEDIITIFEAFLDGELDNKMLEKLKKNIENFKLLISRIQEKVKNLGIFNNCKEIIKEVIREMFERWLIRANLYNIYRRIPNNKRFTPYQQEVYIKRNGNVIEEIVKVGSASSEEGYEKAFLYNSTRMDSKKNHYLILDKNDDQCYEITDSIINSYNRNHEKIKESSDVNTKVINFYDIFERKKSEDSIYNCYSEGVIVFYQLDENNKIKNIGRTPYFKIAYERSIGEIIERDKKINRISYADALFGYTLENYENEKSSNISKSYKSRLRFSSLEIINNKCLTENLETKKANFILMSPSATCNKLYLKYKDPKKKMFATYNDQEAELNGYKYYHLRKEKKEPIQIVSQENSKEQNEKKKPQYACKDILAKCDFIEMKGKIFFDNLSKFELGLLIASIDINKLKMVMKNDSKKENHINHYEQIGGAKPYGYGRILVNVDSVYINNEQNSFESLIKNKFEKQEQCSVKVYLEEFKSIMTNKENCDSNYNGYVNNIFSSKQIIEDKEKTYNKKIEICTWDKILEMIKNSNQNINDYTKRYTLLSRNK